MCTARIAIVEWMEKPRREAYHRKRKESRFLEILQDKDGEEKHTHKHLGTLRTHAKHEGTNTRTDRVRFHVKRICSTRTSLVENSSLFPAAIVSSSLANKCRSDIPKLTCVYVFLPLAVLSFRATNRPANSPKTFFNYAISRYPGGLSLLLVELSLYSERPLLR